MADAALFGLLDAYLHSVVDVLSSWGEWLAEHERLVLDADIRALESHAASAAQLHSDLADLSHRRAQLLTDAQASGLTCSTLKQLAQSLPQWSSHPDFRLRVKNAERSMHNLRRLNIAAWMLVNQCARVVDETLMLMTCGVTQAGAYIDVPGADTSGGQILDTQA
jgi:hypothetical protein